MHLPSSHSFFFNDTATTEIYTLSLHDALPIFRKGLRPRQIYPGRFVGRNGDGALPKQGSALPDARVVRPGKRGRSEEHTSELQSRLHLVCRLLLEKKKKKKCCNIPTD